MNSSRQPKKVKFKLWGSSKISTDPGLRGVRLEVVNFSLSNLEDKSSELEEDCQSG